MFRNAGSHSSFKVAPRFHPLYLISRWFYGHIVGFVLNDELMGGEKEKIDEVSWWASETRKCPTALSFKKREKQNAIKQGCMDWIAHNTHGIVSF